MPMRSKLAAASGLVVRGTRSDPKRWFRVMLLARGAASVGRPHQAATRAPLSKGQALQYTGPYFDDSRIMKETAVLRALAALSQDWLLPGLDQVLPNTVSLLETNQAFIEAYMVGLNHEFSRELLWNEYPTDQRGSYFRQFWNVAGRIEFDNICADDRRGLPVDRRQHFAQPQPAGFGMRDTRGLGGVDPVKVDADIEWAIKYRYV